MGIGSVKAKNITSKRQKSEESKRETRGPLNSTQGGKKAGEGQKKRLATARHAAGKKGGKTP